MSTPLNQIQLSPAKDLILTTDILDDIAYAAVTVGLNLTQDAKLTDCTIPPPGTGTSNLLIVRGTLSSFLGLGPVQVSLYLFEVATISGYVERHAIILYTGVPVAVNASALIAAFCPPSPTGSLPLELALMKELTFSQQTLLFSTLDYASASYQDPPFPPMQDVNAPQAFLKLIQPDLTAGYIFSAQGQLQSTYTFPQPPVGDAYILDIGAVLAQLGLGSVCTNTFSLNGQIALSSLAPRLNLLYQINGGTLNNIPLKPNITEVGIGFPLGSGVAQIPVFELNGTITLATKPSNVQMLFDPTTTALSVMFTELPDLTDLEQNFGQGVLSSILGSFLPDGVMADLGSIEIQELGICIDCAAPGVSALSLSVTTENPWALFDGITVQPALIANFSYPFESYRSVDVQVCGKWFFKDAELDMTFVYDHDPTKGNKQELFFAQLALGTGINFTDLAEQLFHADIAGLPSLVISGVEVGAQRIITSGITKESISLEIDVSAGWTLDGIAIDLDNLSLAVSFTKASSIASWVLQNANLQGTLEIGPAFFNLSADYDVSDKSWTFTGGTLPGDTVQFDLFLTSLTTALSLPAPGSFLDPFKSLNITGCYFNYQCSSAGSPIWQITVSLDLTSASPTFQSVNLDQVVLSFSRDGSGTSFSFDATTPTTQTQSVNGLITSLGTEFGLTIALPGALNGIALEGLSASYNSSTENFSFVVYVKLTDKAFVQLGINVTSQPGVTTKDYYMEGTLIFNAGDPDELTFELILEDSVDIGTSLIASLQADSTQTVSLVSLLKAIDNSISGLGGFDIDIKNALFVHSTGGAKPKSLFAIDMGGQINLSKLGSLPIIGGEMTDIDTLDLSFQVMYAIGDNYKAAEITDVNNMLGITSFQFPAQDITAGSPFISTSMRAGSDKVINMTLPISIGSDGTVSGSPGNVQPQDPNVPQTGAGNNAVTWFTLNKAFGPVHINRVGLAFDNTDMIIMGYLDGGVSIGPLTFDLLGLNVGIPLTDNDKCKKKFVPIFGLQGLGLGYQSGPIEIAGALFQGETTGAVEYDGFVTISTESLEIGAIGSFAEMNDGQKSLFVYAVLAEPLGGPAFFFVTGLAAGFGYNRKLLPPLITDVQNFPLVAQAMAPSTQPAPGDMRTARDYIAQQLQLLQNNIVAVAGEYFLAVGIKFTSFELVDGFLLAIVQFGNELRLDMMGLANASLPPDTTNDPIAEAQLAILAHYVPSEGSVWVQGQLTSNSYILSPNCHLTGGFAFACWTNGANAGNFVVTIGGYGPNYLVPDYYPNPPQVGFNWQVSDNLNVKGGGYFALVPHALMAGGSLQATWQSGDVKAWFLMGADFLIEWKPFHYQADIYVDLGAELIIHFFGTHHVSIDASADLNVWGPEFGGHAHITVKVIGIHFHFNIDFGASPEDAQPLKWAEFQSSFLPADNKQWLAADIQGGLIRTVKGTLPHTSTQVDVWVVKRDELNIITTSVLPIMSVNFMLDTTQGTLPSLPSTIIGVAPMNLQAIDISLHTITITQLLTTKGALGATPTEQLVLIPNIRKVPAGMWGGKMLPDLNPPPGTEILDAISGFSIVPVPPLVDPTAIVVARALLAYETTQKDGFEWVADTGTFSGSQADWITISATLQSTLSARTAALASLGFGNFRENYNQPLDRDSPVKPNLGSLN